jgi:hypothetical protein
MSVFTSTRSRAVNPVEWDSLSGPQISITFSHLGMVLPQNLVKAGIINGRKDVRKP